MSIALKRAFIPPMYGQQREEIGDATSGHKSYAANKIYAHEHDGLHFATSDLLLETYDFCELYWEIGPLRRAPGLATPLRLLNRGLPLAPTSTGPAILQLTPQTIDPHAMSQLVSSAIQAALEAFRLDMSADITRSVIAGIATVAVEQNALGITQHHRIEGQNVAPAATVTDVNEPEQPLEMSVSATVAESAAVTPALAIPQLVFPPQIPSTFSSSVNVLAHLQEFFQDPNAEFTCPAQQQLLEATCSRVDNVVAIIGTGKGKSLAFELPPMYEDKRTVVVHAYRSMTAESERRAHDKQLKWHHWTASDTDVEDARLIILAVESFTTEAFQRFAI
jgi:hypothetical protein